MYFHVPSEPMMQKLGKLLSSPLSSLHYTDLKTELLTLRTLSDKQCYAAFSRDVVLGDSKPSDLLPASKPQLQAFKLNVRELRNKVRNIKSRCHDRA